VIVGGGMPSTSHLSMAVSPLFTSTTLLGFLILGATATGKHGSVHTPTYPQLVNCGYVGIGTGGLGDSGGSKRGGWPHNI